MVDRYLLTRSGYTIVLTAIAGYFLEQAFILPLTGTVIMVPLIFFTTVAALVFIAFITGRTGPPRARIRGGR